MSEKIEFHGWLGKKKKCRLPLPGVFFWNSPYSFDDGIEKSIPQDHRLSSFGRPHDAKQQSS